MPKKDKKEKKEKKKSKEKKPKKSKKDKDDMPAPSAPALAGSDTAGGTVAAPSGATSQTPAFSAGQLFEFNAFNHAVVYVVVVVNPNYFKEIKESIASESCKKIEVYNI